MTFLFLIINVHLSYIDVLLKVSKKLADTVLFRRFKKCWIFTMHMHDNQFIYQDLRRHVSIAYRHNIK